MSSDTRQILWFDQLGTGDISRVGGKNASLGELARNLATQGLATPPGFAIPTSAYWAYVESNDFGEVMRTTLRRLDAGELELAQAGETMRILFLQGRWPDDTAQAITDA
jgi:pyruvate, water dikinase